MSEKELDEIRCQPSSSAVTISVSQLPWTYYAKNLMSLAVPSTLAFLSWNLQGLVCIYFVGRLDNVTYLDAYAFAYTWSGIFAFSMILGLGSGMDTLVSQSFGRGDYRDCGMHLVRGFAVLSVAALPCCVMLLISDKLFGLIGMDPTVAEHAYKCTLSLIPAVIMDIPLILLEKFLIGQRIARPQMFIQGFNTCICPVYCYMFVFKFNMGYYGAAATRVFAELVYIAGMVTYICLSGSCSRTFVRPSLEMIKGWRQYVRVALPTMLMICLEWWSCSILSVLCARFGVVDLAAHSIGLNCTSIVFVTCLGIGIAAGTLVGNSIGEKNIQNAKRYAAMGAALTVAIVQSIVIPCFIFRRSIAGLFSRNDDVISKVVVLIGIMVVLETFDGMQGTLGKILIGMGRQNQASRVNLFTYYVLMIPAGVFFGAYMGYGVYGVWLAFTLATVVVSIGFASIIYRQDWEQLAKDCELRAEKTKAETMAKEGKSETLMQA